MSMGTVLEKLEERIDTLEKEVAWLRRLVQSSWPNLAPRGSERESDATSDTTAHRFCDVVYPNMEASGTPPGIEKLRELLAAHGVRPGDEAVREEILGMRSQEIEE
jgi:hypothetical protein